jgi:hypothetical protein
MTTEPVRTPEQISLDFFVGDWTAKGQVMPGRFGPGGPTEGDTAYRWDMGGRWLTFQSRLSLPGMGAYVVNGGVSYDASRSTYQSFAYNSLGVLIAYDGQWEDADTLAFTSTYHTPNTARVVYRRLPGDAILMRSEQATPAGAFETYFETTLTRR